jgi:hypothetical protein
MRKRWILVSSLMLLLMLAFVLLPTTVFASADDSSGQAASSSNVTLIERSPTFIAIEQTLAQGGPVKDDLIKRGLVTFPTPDGKGGMTPGVIQTSKIDELASTGVYHITEANTFELGPQTPKVINVTATASVSYKYAAMQTKKWNSWDEYKYRGHTVYVDIPSNIVLSSGTIHNIYTNHLALSDGQWIESGVGWVNWASSPILFTYTSYTGNWTWLSIPSGTPRTIFLRLEVQPSGQSEMYASDSYYGYQVDTFQQVTSLNFRVDQCQEQCSTGVWTQTPMVLQHDNMLKNTNNQWVNWNNAINTNWFADSPMHQNYGIQNDKKWIDTWCSP